MQRGTWKLQVCAAMLLVAGCRAPLEVWKEQPQARGGFGARLAMVYPAEAWLREAVGLEVKATYELSPDLAVECSMASWVAEDKNSSSSHLQAAPLRFTALYRSALSPGRALSVGAGVTFVEATSQLGYAELVEWAALGYYYLAFDLERGIGFHAQAEAQLLLADGLTVGVFLRHTIVNADFVSTWWDGFALQESHGSWEMGSTDVGLVIGADF